MPEPSGCHRPQSVSRFCKSFLPALLVLSCSVLAQPDRQRFERAIDAGFDALERNAFEEARISFTQALRLREDSAEATCYLGLAHYKSGDMVAALDHFERSLHLDETIADSAFLFYRALAARQLGLVSHEERAWRALIEFDPQSRFAQRGAEAIKEMPNRQHFGPDIYFEQGRKLAPSHPYAAVLFFIESVEETLRANQGTEGLELPMSWLLTYLNRTRQPDQVLLMEKPVKVLEGSTDNIHLQLAIARVSLGDCEEAEDHLAKVGTTRFPAARQQVAGTCRSVREKYGDLIQDPDKSFHLERIEPKLFKTLCELGDPENPEESTP